MTTDCVHIPVHKTSTMHYCPSCLESITGHKPESRQLARCWACDEIVMCAVTSAGQIHKHMKRKT